jgi:hypothetical protein
MTREENACQKHFNWLPTFGKKQKEIIKFEGNVIEFDLTEFVNLRVNLSVKSSPSVKLTSTSIFQM